MGEISIFRPTLGWLVSELPEIHLGSIIELELVDESKSVIGWIWIGFESFKCGFEFVLEFECV